MNRCLSALSSRLLLSSALLISVCGLATAPAAAQGFVRQFPTAALRGTLQVTAPPQILVNSKPERLSPGARIRSTNNLLVMSASLVGQQLLVNYVRDGQGMIHEVWILSESEAQEKRAGMATRTNIVFGSDAENARTNSGLAPFEQPPKLPGN